MLGCSIVYDAICPRSKGRSATIFASPLAFHIIVHFIVIKQRNIHNEEIDRRRINLTPEVFESYNDFKDWFSDPLTLAIQKQNVGKERL